VNNLITSLASMINERVNIPLLPEAAEQRLFENAVEGLVQQLPDYLRALLEAHFTGDTDTVLEILTTLVHNQIADLDKRLDLPWVSDQAEAHFFDCAADAITKVVTEKYKESMVDRPF